VELPPPPKNFLVTPLSDITPLDFFLWGYIKDKVFSTPVADITDLKARITDAFATITEDMLENTWRESDYYNTDTCRLLRVNVNKNGRILNLHFKFRVFIICFEIICLFIYCFKNRPCY
jgi:hypothetical protein